MKDSIELLSGGRTAEYFCSCVNPKFKVRKSLFL